MLMKSIGAHTDSFTMVKYHGKIGVLCTKMAAVITHGLMSTADSSLSDFQFSSENVHPVPE